MEQSKIARNIVSAILFVLNPMMHHFKGKKPERFVPLRKKTLTRFGGKIKASFFLRSHSESRDFREFAGHPYTHMDKSIEHIQRRTAMTGQATNQNACIY